MDTVLKIKKLSEEAIIPVRQHDGDAGMDICSIEDTIISPNTTKLVKTGLSMEIPYGYEIQVRSRSGLAAKKSVFVLNSPGTVDCQYRGEICVVMHNLGKEDFEIHKGDRIAQIIMNKVEMCSCEEVKELSETIRGEGGFGSTGVSKK